MEVDTPVLSTAAVSDPFIDPMVTGFCGPGVPSEQRFYLQTSPEYAMKRLLAAGSGPIYQLAKAFRNGEAGARHNPEFTLLEWYRPGFDDHDLMVEVSDLVHSVLGCGPVRSLSYRELFQEQLGIDPHRAPVEALRALTRERVDIELVDEDRTTWLNLLLTHVIEPTLQAATFIYDFPADQAALSRVMADDWGQPVARRFELYIKGLELANGYFELTDGVEQQRRFEADNRTRQQLGLQALPYDQRLVAALKAGMPACAGVALGLERLLMLASGASHIGEVMAFTLDRA
jgi:lysyl-tRNA synthetase class 2